MVKRGLGFIHHCRLNKCQVNITNRETGLGWWWRDIKGKLYKALFVELLLLVPNLYSRPPSNSAKKQKLSRFVNVSDFYGKNFHKLQYYEVSPVLIHSYSMKLMRIWTSGKSWWFSSRERYQLNQMSNVLFTNFQVNANSQNFKFSSIPVNVFFFLTNRDFKWQVSKLTFNQDVVGWVWMVVCVYSIKSTLSFLCTTGPLSLWLKIYVLYHSSREGWRAEQILRGRKRHNSN